MKSLQQRSAWFSSLIATALLGYMARWLWSTSDGPGKLMALFVGLTCARGAWVSLNRLAFAAEVRSLRRKASRELVPYNEARFELLTSAERPNVAFICSEHQKLQDEMERSAARRRLMLLEAGVDLPDRSR